MCERNVETWGDLCDGRHGVGEANRSERLAAMIRFLADHVPGLGRGLDPERDWDRYRETLVSTARTLYRLSAGIAVIPPRVTAWPERSNRKREDDGTGPTRQGIRSTGGQPIDRPHRDREEES